VGSAGVVITAHELEDVEGVVLLRDGVPLPVHVEAFGSDVDDARAFITWATSDGQETLTHDRARLAALVTEWDRIGDWPECTTDGCFERCASGGICEACEGDAEFEAGRAGR